jgi:hypothetical protein
VCIFWGQVIISDAFAGFITVWPGACTCYCHPMRVPFTHAAPCVVGTGANPRLLKLTMYTGRPQGVAHADLLRPFSGNGARRLETIRIDVDVTPQRPLFISSDGHQVLLRTCVGIDSPNFSQTHHFPTKVPSRPASSASSIPCRTQWRIRRQT